MPEINGLLETGFSTSDLQRARTFYQEVMGFEPLHEDERGSIYGLPGDQLLIVVREESAEEVHSVSGSEIPPWGGPGTVHIAFAVDRDQIESWTEHLEAAGVSIESRVEWERGGVSIYFRDPDGNVLEMASPGIWPTY